MVDPCILTQPGGRQLVGPSAVIAVRRVGRVRRARESMDPTLSPFAETTTDDNGEFSVEVQASGVYHLHFSGDGIVTTAFAGIVGQSDIALSSGSVFVRTESEVAALRDMHENCPSASESAA